MSSNTNIPIVFIHIWRSPPPWMREAVKQARLWNPDAPIVCISSVVEDYGVGEEWIAIEDIPESDIHRRFQETTLLRKDDNMDGFWRWTTERMFVLEDWMRWKGVDECFHLENDNMLYENISRVVPLLRETSPGLSTTFQGQGSKMDTLRTCFSVLYCRSIEALRDFNFYLAAAPSSVDEMTRGGLYWDTNEDTCSYLATAPVGVVLKSEKYRHWIEDARFSELGVIFDSTTHGQYLGGVDPNRHAENTAPGFLNPDCDFRADQYQYTWVKDEAGRRYPVIQDSNGKPWKIMNIHLHCKRLHDFRS